MKELEAVIGVGITLTLHGLFISKNFFAYYNYYNTLHATHLVLGFGVHSPTMLREQ